MKEGHSEIRVEGEAVCEKGGKKSSMGNRGRACGAFLNKLGIRAVCERNWDMQSCLCERGMGSSLCNRGGNQKQSVREGEPWRTVCVTQ